MGSCEVDDAEEGYDECRCPCSCEDDCGGVAVNLEELLEGDEVVPASGLRLTAIPPQQYLEMLDKAKYLGVVADGIYFAESFGIVTYADGAARVFPLEAQGKFAIRGCQGQFIRRVYRARSHT